MPDTEAQASFSVDRTNRFSLDKLIRDYGFTILSRASGQDPVWYTKSLEQKEWRQSEIIKAIDWDKVKQALSDDENRSTEWIFKDSLNQK